MSTYAPFAKPLYVMLKPVGAVCNLACDYCYYLEKSKLYVNNPKHVMSDELLEKFIEEYINSQTMPQVLFTWHGGETLMRPLAFYKTAIRTPCTGWGATFVSSVRRLADVRCTSFPLVFSDRCFLACIPEIQSGRRHIHHR